MQIPLNDRAVSPLICQRTLLIGPLANWGMTKWVLLDAAKAYALPILLLSLFKDYPFLIYILVRFWRENLAEMEMMALLATCFLHFGGKPSGNGNDGATSHMFPTFWRQTKDRKWKWGRSRCPFDQKRNRGRLITSLSHHLNRKPEMVAILAWTSYCPRDNFVLAISL